MQGLARTLSARLWARRERPNVDRGAPWASRRREAICHAQQASGHRAEATMGIDAWQQALPAFAPVLSRARL